MFKRLGVYFSSGFNRFPIFKKCVDLMRYCLDVPDPLAQSNHIKNKPQSLRIVAFALGNNLTLIHLGSHVFYLISKICVCPCLAQSFKTTNAP